MKNPAEIFKALSDETRLKIMILLSESEMCVCDLEKILQTTQTKISRHLSVLKYNKLVKSRREYQWVYYSLAEIDDDFTKSILSSFAFIRKQYFPDFDQIISNLTKCDKNNDKI